jgi:CDP-glucose 4,6-dehydratase
VTRKTANTQFWTGKKVFITGHTGFKGAWLSHWLYHLGARVVGFSKYTNAEQKEFADSVENLIAGSVVGDICCSQQLANCLQHWQPEIVFHLAAQPIVRRSFTDVIETFETNLMGTVNLLEAIRQTSSVQAVVIVTSDKCYKNLEKGLSFTEDNSLGGDDPYSASKACAEIATNAFTQSFFRDFSTNRSAPRVATARAGNIIGGGDWGEDRLIPDLARALQTGEKVQIRFPKAVRPWQFVLDALAGYLVLAERLYCDGDEFVGAWNFGPMDGNLYTVERVAKTFCGKNGPSIELKNSARDALNEKISLSLNSSKAKKQLGWFAQMPITTFLSRTRRWYEMSIDGTPVDILCKQEFEFYQNFTASQ